MMFLASYNNYPGAYALKALHQSGNSVSNLCSLLSLFDDTSNCYQFLSCLFKILDAFLYYFLAMKDCVYVGCMVSRVLGGLSSFSI